MIYFQYEKYLPNRFDGIKVFENKILYLILAQFVIKVTRIKCSNIIFKKPIYFTYQ